MKNNRRMFQIAAVIGLMFALLLSDFHFVLAAQTDTERIVITAAEILYNNEGSYDSVNPDDNGAVSIGKLQWHGWRALSLLQTIVKANVSQAQELLGNKLYQEVITTTDTSKWSTRKFTNAEAKAAKKLLSTAESKTAQDELAHRDITSYVEQGLRLGITNEAALIYFADLANQGGSGAAGRVGRAASQIAGSYGAVTLNELHKAAICDSVMGNSAYYSRRFGTYNYAAGLGWKFCNTNDSFIPYDYPSALNNGAAWIQRSLNTCMKAGLSVSGVYDEATRAAVTAFQSAKNLEVDGQAGRNTIVKIIKAIVNGEMIYAPNPDVPVEKPPIEEPDIPVTPPQEPDTPAKKTTVLRAEKASYAVNDTNKAFTVNVTSNHTETKLEYVSSNPSVVTIRADGNVEVKSAGSAKITVSQAETSKYTAAALSIPVTIYATNPDAYAVPSGALYEGKTMQQQHIQWLQAALMTLGEKEMTVNGKWSSTLTKRVSNFQQKCGLEADGIAGDMTQSVIKNMLAVQGKQPSLALKSSANANTVTWNQFDSINRVYIYRKEKGGKYSKIKLMKNMSKTSYKDKAVEAGKTYFYKVKYGYVQNKMKVTSLLSKRVKGVCS